MLFREEWAFNTLLIKVGKNARSYFCASNWLSVNQGSPVPSIRKVPGVWVSFIAVLKVISGLKVLSTVVMEISFSTEAGALPISGSTE